jgi:hypothetical protein
VAPIALFVYNRLWHTRQTVHALLHNGEAAGSDLIVFSDGPKDDLDRVKVEEVRRFVKEIRGFRSVRVVESNTNKGLANSIISGVSDVLRESENIIVLEDDIVASPYFLSYMNQALLMYKDEPKVISIHAFLLPVKDTLPQSFFLRGADCWGWATWRRGWALFEKDGSRLLRELKNKNLLYDFDFQNAYSFSKMLSDQIAGKNDSWAVRWHASAFLTDKLTLYPGVSLVKNIGLDNSGTHSGSSNDFDVNLAHNDITLVKIPAEENERARKIISSYLRSKNTLTNKIAKKLKHFLDW